MTGYEFVLFVCHLIFGHDSGNLHERLTQLLSLCRSIQIQKDGTQTLLWTCVSPRLLHQMHSPTGHGRERTRLLPYPQAE
jgi:hypothetical protein